MSSSIVPAKRVAKCLPPAPGALWSFPAAHLACRLIPAPLPDRSPAAPCEDRHTRPAPSQHCCRSCELNFQTPEKLSVLQPLAVQPHGSPPDPAGQDDAPLLSAPRAPLCVLPLRRRLCESRPRRYMAAGPLREKLLL